MASKTSGFLFGPTPHDEAIKLIADKTPVKQAVFKELLPELRARSFAVAGIEAFDVLQEVRDTIADLPLGGDWDGIKKDLVTQISPYIVTSTDPDERAKQKANAIRRAELLLRTHGFQAYNGAAYQVMDRQREVFPFWRYQSAGDGRVRHSHAALDGIVLPANSPFWRGHYPPWEWGCRCQVIPLMPEDVDDIKADEAHLPIEKRSVLEGAALDEVEQKLRLVRGPNDIADLRNAKEKGNAGGFHWDPADLHIPVSALQGRYDSATWNDFQGWAKGQSIDGTRSVWDWMGGAGSAPAKPVVALKSTNLTEATEIAGISNKAVVTEDDMRKLIAELHEDAPVDVATKLETVSGTKDGATTRELIRSTTQEFLNFLPPKIAAALPKVSIKVAKMAARGDYNFTGAHSPVGKIRLNRGLKADPAQMKRTLWHELMHWVHMEGPPEYAAQIKAHFEARTAGEPVIQFPHYTSGTTGKRDQWYEIYAGRIYSFGKESTHLGMEVPTRYVEPLTDPVEMARLWNNPGHRATLEIVLSAFYETK